MWLGKSHKLGQGLNQPVEMDFQIQLSCNIFAGASISDEMYTSPEPPKKSP